MQVAANTAAIVRVILTDSSGVPVVGQGAGDVTVTYYTPGSAVPNIAANASWLECSLGVYQMAFTGGEVGASLGSFNFVVANAGSLNFYGEFPVVADGPISKTLIKAALTEQGYTTTRGGFLDRLDAAVSTVASAIAALNDLSAEDAADAVLDEILSGHAIAGSTGAALTAAAAGGEFREAIVAAAFRGGSLILVGFLLTNGEIDTTGTECRITIYDEDGTVAMATQTDSTPDALGMFAITVASNGGLVNNRAYKAVVEIDTPSGTVTTPRALPTL